MRKILLLFIMFFSITTTFSQNVTVNPGGGSYADLSSAFTAINLGTHTGAVTVSIVGNTAEPVGGAILNASGSGAASYTSITISPSGGTARTITGAATAGLPLIDLNGADNVTFDGLNTGGNSLTIENTTSSATAGTCTIRFIGGATGNTITNCIIQGSSSSSVATSAGTIFFSTDGVTANGNDNNTISNNDIGPSGTNLPTKAILGNGSTSTTAIGNSGNIINNNNIFDYFGAAVTSAGVATLGGCNAWSITNNRFYQTGTRTWATGAIHRAIDIGNTTATSGAQGFTITGNIIGYATNTQTGTYTLTGTGTGAKFQGINFNGISSGTLSNINNNTVASVSLSGVTASGTSTSSPFTGILVANGVANTNNNTIGNQSATGSLVFSTTTTTSTEIYGIFNFSVNNWTSNSNTIGGISVTNAGASGTFVIYGMRANTGTTLTWGASTNTIGGNIANSIQLSATGASSQVVGMQTPNAISTFTGNTVRNLTTNIGTGTTTTASAIGIAFTSTTPTQTVSQNTIHTLTNTNATAASVVTGIQFTGSGSGNVVERNLIYGLIVATTSTSAEVNGIRVAGGTTTYRNNMIAIGAGITNAIGAAATNNSTAGIVGINEALGTNSFFHNSIYIGGAPTAGVGASYAFNGVQTTNTRSFRNNIFFNARSNSGATGKNYAVKINGTAANPAGLTINNNLYFANGTGAVFGFFNSLDVANIAAWRTAVGQDAGSFESNPQYNDPTNTIPDLHLHPTNATVAEGNGVDVGVTNDFDGQTRSGLTPVDIGADAGNFVGIDLAAPNITYSALGFTCTIGDRTLNTNITDVTGVPTTGALQPRIYYRKNAGVWFSSQGVLASGTGTNGTWNFTIIAADMGGLVISDNVQYYVIAQDAATTPNIGSNPATGLVATDVNTVTTAPTTPNNYNVVATLNGTYTVGAAGVYPTLTAAFNAYNNSCLGGPIVFSLVDAAYSITSDTLRANPFASSTNTLTIRPAATGTTISGNLNGPAIVLLDADYITIDGSSIGSSAGAFDIGGNAAIRDLTIANTNLGTSAAVISIATGVNGAQNNTVKNVNILGQDPNTSLIGIAIGGNTLGTVGADNDNNTIDNCSVRKTIFGIYNAGISGVNRNTGSKITRNDLSATTTNRIKRLGILTFNNDGIEITYNSIGGIETTESADAIGIALGNQSIDQTTTTSGEVVNALVANNTINGVASLSATGFSAAGITVAGGNSGANIIRNNTITGVTAPATSPDIVAGIYVVGAAGSNTRLYFNSVSMTGDRGAVATQSPSYGIAITGTNPTVDIRNNILYTTQIASGGGVDAKSYAIGMVSTTFTNLTSNYNAFWSTGANAGGYRTGSLAGAAGTDYATLALFSTATSTDNLSVNNDPAFTNPTNNLLPTLGYPGVTIAGITTDIVNNSRANPPTIGAYEAPLFGSWKIAAGSNDWDVNTNWVGDVLPTSTSIVIIPATASPMPTVNSSTNTSVAGINNNGTITATGTVGFNVTGDVINNGTITTVTGSLTLNGTSAQTISGVGSISNLTINNAAGITISTGAIQSITGVFTPTAGNITTTGRIILKSTSVSNTAQVGVVGGAVTIGNNVQVERFIPSGRRAYRMLAPGVTTTSFIKDNWQEGANNTAFSPWPASNNNPNPGYGTHITGSTTGLNGFDATLLGNPSLQIWNTAGNAWAYPANTNATVLEAKKGYAILIRGDRSSDLNTNTANGSTTLRALGALSTGAVTFTGGDLSSNATGFSLIGNPYWAQVDWEAVGKTNVSNTYWIFDPQVGVRGAYTSYTTGGATSGGGAINRFLQPGQAIFVQNTSAAPTLNFTEANKNISGTLTSTFRTKTDGKFIVKLTTPALQSEGRIADASTIYFGSDFTAAAGVEDASKFTNPDEMIAFNTTNKLLGVDARPLPEGKDTAFLNLSQYRSNNYVMEIEGKEFSSDAQYLEAWLVDSYKNTRTAISKDGKTTYAYTTDGNAASTAAGRFYIVFDNKKVVLPISTNSLEVKLTPNPATEYVQVNYSARDKGKTTIRIIGSNGQTITTVNLGDQQNGQYRVPVSRLATGMYTVEVIVGNDKQTAKLVKQ